MRRWIALATACLVAFGLFCVVAPASAQNAYDVTAKLTFLGNLGPNGEQRYRFDYTVANNTVFPDIGAFQAFFNSDPVTQTPSGDKATFVSYASPSGWEAVTVMQKNAYGQWSLNWDWDYATLPEIVQGSSLGGFAVVFDWNDPATVPGVQLTQARNGSAHDVITTVPPSRISGTVTANCGTPVGLQGITVDLFVMDYLGEEELVASTATDADGHFTFVGLPLGSYSVVIVTPLGYVADANIKSVLIEESGSDLTTDFALACQVITAEPRTIGYWKHQVNCYLSGKGTPQETLTAMVNYIDLILTHFNQNITNPVIIYVPDANTTTDELRKLDQLLTVNKNATMSDRAKQQILALLLNVVSGKIAQTHVIAENGATVSQAITYCNDLIQDDLDSTDETAKTIADLINNGQTVPGAMVPASTRIVAYRRAPVFEQPTAFRLDPAAPNPSRGGAVAIGFALGRAADVDLCLFDVSGRAVKTLARGAFAAGPHHLMWDGTNDSGARVEPGVYFYRIVTGEGVLTRTVVLQR